MLVYDKARKRGSRERRDGFGHGEGNRKKGAVDDKLGLCLLGFGARQLSRSLSLLALQVVRLPHIKPVRTLLRYCLNLPQQVMKTSNR